MNKKPLLLLLALTIYMIGYWIPEDRHVPVEGAQPYDWSANAAYAYKIGGSNALKGINIFANNGTPVEATTSGLVLYSDKDSQGESSVWVFFNICRFYFLEIVYDVWLISVFWV